MYYGIEDVSHYKYQMYFNESDEIVTMRVI
jgi:hypothetical protein